MEGPLPPLTKIVDDVEGVGVEVMLALGMVDASGMPPGLARVRASFYGHDAPS